MDRRRLIFTGVAAAGLATTSRRARAQAVDYTYDALGRVTSATYADGDVITYAYDPAGNRTQVKQGPPGPPPAPLSAAISVTTWNCVFYDGIPNNPPTVVVTAGGGVAPYAYLWERVSGDAVPWAINPTSASTRFGRDEPPPGPPRASIWRCRVTDATATVAYSPTVRVTFYSSPN